jgi:hypothetical protein
MSCSGCSSVGGSYQQPKRSMNGVSIRNNNTGESFKMVKADDGNGNNVTAFQYQPGKNGETDLLKKLTDGMKKGQDQLKKLLDKIMGKDENKTDENDNDQDDNDQEQNNNPLAQMAKFFKGLSALSKMMGGKGLLGGN